MNGYNYTRIARILAVVAAVFLLWLAFFAFRVASVKSAIAKRILAESSRWSSTGSMEFEKFRGFPSGSAPLTIDRASIKFAPLYNLLFFSSCDARLVISGDAGSRISPVISAGGCEKLVFSLISDFLGSSAPKSVRYSISVDGHGYETDRIFNFRLDAKVRLERFEITGRSDPAAAEIDSMRMSLACSNGQTCSVAVRRNPGGSFDFECSSAPVSLLKPRALNFAPNAGTGEIALRFTAPALELGGTEAVSAVRGTVSNFEFFFAPFRSNLRAGFAFSADSDRIVLSDAAPASPPDTRNRLTGAFDLKSGSMNLEYQSPDFELSCFARAFAAAGGLISHYSPSGKARIFVKIEGSASAPEVYGELSLNNAMLGGDAGFKNISNIFGLVNFSNSRVTFSEISGLMGNSKVAVAGSVGIGPKNDFKPAISVTFSEMPAAELKNSIKFPGGDLEKVLENVSEGRVSLTVKVDEKAGGIDRFYAEGEFARCRISFPMRPGSIALTEVGGKIAISDNALTVANAYGFIGSVPFFFDGSIRQDSTPKYNFSIKFQNLDFSDVNIGESLFSGFFAVISRIQVRNRSRIEFKASSNEDLRFSVDLLFDMSNPEFSLYPLPFTIQTENSNGFINFSYDLTSSAFDVNSMGMKLRGASKITVLTGDFLQIPVSLSGESGGELSFFKKGDGESYINGSFGMKSGTMRYFDNKYVELLARVSDLSSIFTIQKSVMAGSCRFGVADGTANLDYRCGFDSDKPMSQISFSLDGVKLERFYEENPKINHHLGGTLQLSMKNSFEGKAEKNQPKASGRISLTNGFVAGLSVQDATQADGISGDGAEREIEPDTLFNFTRFGFSYSFSRAGLKISNPEYEGSRKPEFLKMFNGFSETGVGRP